MPFKKNLFYEVDGTYGPQLPEGKRRRTQEEKDDRLSFKIVICYSNVLLFKSDFCFRKAYERISEGISEFEEDHLDLDLVEEGEYLERYLAMLRK